MIDERLHAIVISADGWRGTASRLGNNKRDAETAKTGIKILADLIDTLASEMQSKPIEMLCDKCYKKGDCCMEETCRGIKVQSVVRCGGYHKTVESSVMPLKQHNKARIEELVTGMDICTGRSEPIPIEWIEEYNDLIKSKV